MRQSNFNLYSLNVIALSVFAVACLVILIVFVPMWQQLEPGNFLQWFNEHGKTVGIIMLPLEMIPLILSLRSYLKLRKLPGASGKLMLLSNICNIIILTLFFIYFLPVNAAFMDGSMAAEKVRGSLSLWQFVHIIRTVLAFVATVFAMTTIASLNKTLRLVSL